MTLEEEAERADQMLKGRTVARIFRSRAKSVGIEFTDGTRFFVDWQAEGSLDLSITGLPEED